MNYFSRSRITAFTDALAHALYDTAIERDRSIMFVCDSDVVYRMLFGYLAPRENVSESDELVEALLSAGFLGVVNLLRPHAIELHASIQREASHSDHGPTGEYGRRIDNFLESRNVRSAIAELLEAVSDGAGLEAGTPKFLAVLRKSGAAAFVAIELAHGVWQERLRRLNGSVLNLSGVGDPMRALLEDPDTWTLFHQIGQRRQDRDVPINNLTDAAALVALKRLVANGRADPQVPVVRFYTTAPSILSLLRPGSSAEIRGALKYDVGDEWRLERSRGAGYVSRSTDYFIVRSSFAALGFGGGRGKPNRSTFAVSVKELQEVLRALTSAILLTGGANDRQLLEAVERVRVGDHSLLNVLQELEHASFLDRLFGDVASIPPSFQEFVSEFPSVYSFIKTGEPRRQIRAEIERDAAVLTREFLIGDKERSIVMLWVGMVKALRERVSELREASGLRTEFSTVDPLRDLGLVRWGARLDDEDLRRAAGWINGLFDDNEATVARTCNEIARTYVDLTTESACLSVAGVLWTLSRFSMVVDVINRWVKPQKSNQISAPLQLMRTAARVRANLSYSPAEQADHMSGLEDQIEAKRDGRLYLGFAYVLYCLARSKGEGSEVEVPLNESKEAAQGRVPWSFKSFQYADRAHEMLLHEPLEAAFAANHCAYVGSLARICSVKTERYLAILRAIPRTDAVWNYRFADTLASVAYWRAYREWAATAPAPNDERKPLICANLTEAREFIDDARPSFGDTEIAEHIEAILRLQQQVGC